MIVESEGSGERRWGRVISARRLRSYGDDYNPIDFTQPYTEPSNYVETNPAGATGTDSGLPQSTWDQFPSEVNPNAPSAGTGLSADQYNQILAAAQQGAKATGDVIKAIVNANGSVSCGAGFIYDPGSHQCYRMSGGGAFGLDTNTLLMLGAGGLGLLAIFYLMK